MNTTNPLLRPSSILLIMLAHSIGWGIRGNFGHQYGAAIAGALSGAAVCVASGREDWRRRVFFVSCFGALGWAFGGTMAYMPVLGYTHTGAWPDLLYGFFAIFVTGFLWSSLGGAATAYAAIEDYEKLTALFRPLAWVLAVWTLDYFFQSDLMRWYEQSQGAGGVRDFRQRSAFYWLDSNWVTFGEALVTLCVFDLWQRRFSKAGKLVVMAAGGAMAGWAVQRALMAMGWMDGLLRFVVRPQGDLTAMNPATGQPFDANDLITNWPRVFADQGAHMGWFIGLLAGLAIYFWMYGEWSSGSGLLMHMAVGGLAVFAILPVFLSNFLGDIGGFRLVPPRGDNWAMVLGALIGALIYARREGLVSLTAATWITGCAGGLGFMLVQFLKLLALMPGNPVLTRNPAVIEAWAHWRHANWHSILAEQGAGLLYGLGVALAMAVVSSRTKVQLPDGPLRRWTEVFAVMLVVNGIVYTNLVKNVADWTKAKTVPLSMKMPLFGMIEFSARGWFNVVFLLFTICTGVLAATHLRRRIAMIPASWTGKGQLFFLVFLWIMTIGNFERAVVAFGEQRLATEAAIFVNALAATLLILCTVRERETVAGTPAPFEPLIRRTLAASAAAFVVFTLAFSAIVHGVYGGQRDGWGGNIRFGPNADWRVKPLLKSAEHR